MGSSSFWDPTKYKADPSLNPDGGKKGLGSYLGSMFQNVFKNVAAPSNIVTLPPEVPASYQRYVQIAQGDNALSDVSARTGAPLSDLVSANAGMQTLPPVGTYISTQQAPAMAQGSAVFGGATPPNNSAQTNISQQPDSTKQARGNPAGTYLIQQRDEVNQSFNSFNEMYRLTGTVDTKLLPTSINLSTVKALEAKGFFGSAVDANGNPLSPAQALQQYGYTYKDGKFVQSGAPGSQSQQNNQPREGQIMDNKFVLVNKSGKLVWEQINKGGGGSGHTGAGMKKENASSTQSTTLGTKLGSG